MQAPQQGMPNATRVAPIALINLGTETCPLTGTAPCATQLPYLAPPATWFNDLHASSTTHDLIAEVLVAVRVLAVNGMPHPPSDIIAWFYTLPEAFIKATLEPPPNHAPTAIKAMKRGGQRGRWMTLAKIRIDRALPILAPSEAKKLSYGANPDRPSASIAVLTWGKTSLP